MEKGSYKEKFLATSVYERGFSLTVSLETDTVLIKDFA